MAIGIGLERAFVRGHDPLDDGEAKPSAVLAGMIGAAMALHEIA